MTYARARLWLGISGVGSLVVMATMAIIFRVPNSLLTNSQLFSWADLGQLIAVVFAVNLWMLPFDYFGGFRLPRKFRKSADNFAQWSSQYLVAVIMQSALFVIFAMSILVAGRTFGLLGGLLAICGGMIVCLLVRNGLMRKRQINSDSSSEKLVEALELVRSWKISVPQIMIVEHRDVGFTGGIIGFGSSVRIVIPSAWLQTMTNEQLATAIARRAIAISSGSYTRGVVTAILWNVIGFALCCSLPNIIGSGTILGSATGLGSVAALMTTFCWFTLWSFVGLLVLPTASRGASLQIDHLLSQQGVPTDLIFETAHSLDEMQDGEPDRPKLIEAIFHPVPNASSRNQGASNSTLAAWNVARTTLFFSWSCFGVLSRAVHCNVGRPELWTMLPTD